MNELEYIGLIEEQPSEDISESLHLYQNSSDQTSYYRWGA